VVGTVILCCLQGLRQGGPEVATRCLRRVTHQLLDELENLLHTGITSPQQLTHSQGHQLLLQALHQGEPALLLL
jgi:hypothetical protein